MKILQRGKQSITAVPSQAHKRPKDDRYAQGQNYSWNKGYVKPEYWNGHRPGYSYGPGHCHENKSWGQGNGYGKKYGTEDKKRQGKVYRASGTKSHTHYTNHRSRESAKFTPSRGIGGGQRGDDGNGGDKGKSIEVPTMILTAVKSSNPRGRGIEINFVKEKALKITTRAPSGEPDPSQTTVKTKKKREIKLKEGQLILPRQG